MHASKALLRLEVPCAARMRTDVALPSEMVSGLMLNLWNSGCRPLLVMAVFAGTTRV